MRVLFFLSILISGQALAGECRMAIKNLDKLLGNNSVLIDQVHKKLEAKNISIISENELTDGDFSIPDLIAIHNGIVTNPLHSYKFETKSKMQLVPCVALPLCSPVVVEKEVTDISGLNYKHYYSIEVLRDSKFVEIKNEKFQHKFKQRPTVFLNRGTIDGSAEQEDLAIAIAKDIPKCSKLLK